MVWLRDLVADPQLSDYARKLPTMHGVRKEAQPWGWA